MPALLFDRAIPVRTKVPSASYSLAGGRAIGQSSAMPASPRLRARKFPAILLLALLPFAASAQEDKKTDADKPADPDTGESTVEEKTLGILPNPLAKWFKIRGYLYRRSVG